MAQNEAPIILDETEQKIIDIIDAHRDQIIDFAKDIYTHAELGYKEFRTAEKFANFMKALGLPTKEHLAVRKGRIFLCFLLRYQSLYHQSALFRCGTGRQL